MNIEMITTNEDLEVGDVLKTASGEVYMVCFDTAYYFLVDLQSGRCNYKYMSMVHLRDSDLCRTCLKVKANLTLTY